MIKPVRLALWLALPLLLAACSAAGSETTITVPPGPGLVMFYTDN